VVSSAVNRSTPYNWQFLSAPWGGNTNAPNGLRLTPYATANPFDASFYHGDATGVVGLVPFYNYLTLIDGPAPGLPAPPLPVPALPAPALRAPALAAPSLHRTPSSQPALRRGYEERRRQRAKT